MADGSLEEERMTVEEYDKLKKAKRALEALKKRQKTYTYSEVEELMTNYQSFAERCACAYYDREIVLQSAEGWLINNK